MGAVADTLTYFGFTFNCMLDTFITWFAFALLGLLCILVFCLYYLIREQQSQQKRPSQQQPPSRRRDTNPVVSQEVQKRLLNLVHGDSQLAERLVNLSRRPGYSEQWAWEKAIEDLIRDRR